MDRAVNGPSALDPRVLCPAGRTRIAFEAGFFYFWAMVGNRRNRGILLLGTLLFGCETADSAEAPAPILQREGQPAAAVRSPEDESMQAAMDAARGSFDTLLQRFLKDPRPAEDMEYDLKLRFPAGDHVEHVWCGLQSIEGSTMKVQIANVPKWDIGHAFGDTVDATEDMLSDWMITQKIDADTLRYVGGFTVQVFQDRCQSDPDFKSETCDRIEAMNIISPETLAQEIAAAEKAAAEAAKPKPRPRSKRKRRRR